MCSALGSQYPDIYCLWFMAVSEEWDSVLLPCYEARVGFEGMQIGIERAYSNVFLRRVVSEQGRGISDYQGAS